jgi:hypothetical protein
MALLEMYHSLLISPTLSFHMLVFFCWYLVPERTAPHTLRNRRGWPERGHNNPSVRNPLYPQLETTYFRIFLYTSWLSDLLGMSVRVGQARTISPVLNSYHILVRFTHRLFDFTQLNVCGSITAGWPPSSSYLYRHPELSFRSPNQQRTLLA